jgi:hypothetical protein
LIYLWLSGLAPSTAPPRVSYVGRSDEAGPARIPGSFSAVSDGALPRSKRALDGMGAVTRPMARIVSHQCTQSQALSLHTSMCRQFVAPSALYALTEALRQLRYLSNFTMNRVFTTAILPAVAQVPNLQVLELELDCRNDSFPVSPSTPPLTSLRQFKLQGYPKQSAAYVDIIA